MSAFSVFTDRKKITKQTQTPTVEQYYTKRARRISRIRYACLLLTVLFVAYGFAVHGEELTADNFRYMLKFLDFRRDGDYAPVGEIRFDYADGNKGALFGDDLVVLNGEGLSVYSFETDRLQTDRFRMERPKLVTTQKNIFSYDMFGTEVRIYNAHSRLSTIEVPMSVFGFDACDEGSFAVITTEKNYRNSVVVYDLHFNEIYRRKFSDTYIDAVALSPNGNHFLVLGHCSKDGDLQSVIQLYDIREEEPVFSTRFTGELPLMASFLSEDTYAVLTGNVLRTFRIDAPEETCVLPIEQKKLKGCSFADGKILLSFAAEGLTGGTVLRVYDGQMTLCFEKQFSGEVTECTLHENTVYVLGGGTLYLCSLSDGSEQTAETGKDASGILFNTRGDGYIFEKSRVYRIDI